MARIGMLLAAALVLASVEAGAIDIAPIGAPGAYQGFVLTSAGAQVAEVLVQVGGRWTARELSRRETDGATVLELRDFDTSGTGGTPVIGPGSYVRLTAAPGDAFPALDFRLEFTGFDPDAWQKAVGQPCPLSFLALPLDTARLWYVHGLLCPTPRWDPYPMTRSTIRGDWAEGWSYGAALGALTVPAMALWDDESSRLVGYEWAEATLTDKSCKDLGIAYCAGVPGWERQFVTLLANAQDDWTRLTYPAMPLSVASHLRLVCSRDLPRTADPNRLVLEHIYSDYRDLLPAVPAMNDLSWMVDRAVDDLGAVGPSGGGFLSEVPAGKWGWNEMFYDPGTVLYGGDFRSVDQMYKEHKAEAIARFEADLERFLSHVQWETIDGDRCCYWRFPLSGSWNERMGGEPADTVHNVQQFGVGAAMLACYANSGREDLLPYIDGLLNWARHCLYTRGDIADIPESMFTIQTTSLAMEFLLNYWRLYSDARDTQTAARAKQAFDLAHTIVYRNANVTIGDSDERDDLSPAFMMPGNMAKFWLGQISNAELCAPFRSMILMHVETGDPVFKWLVRGALERWWIGYKEDCWHTAENIDVWGVSTGSKGMQTGIHDPCDSFWDYSQPVGDAVMHVTCGAKAAMAFCKGTRALDVADYTYEAGSFGFTVSRVAEGPVPDRFSIIVSSPWRDLRGRQVTVDGEPLGEDRLQAPGAYGEHLYIRGVRVGSRVQIGDAEGAERAALALPTVPTPAAPSRVPREALHIAGRDFSLSELPQAETTPLAAAWGDPDAWAGLPVGLQYAHGVPYQVAACALGPGKSMAVSGKEAYLLGVAAEPGALSVSTGQKRLSIAPESGLVAARGWPLCRWKLMLYPVALPGGEGQVQVSEGGLLLGITTLHDGPGLASQLAQKAEALKHPDAATEALAAEARRRLEQAGGARRVPVAFIPPRGTTYPALARWADRLGLHTVALTPEEFVDRGVFSARTFPVAIYTGNEDYLQTVASAGDGREALLRYVKEGGTLLVAGICRPFTYGRDLTVKEPETGPHPWALLGKEFELFLLGPDERTDDAIGFERPPSEALTMRLCEGQTVLWDLPSELPFPDSGDVRYRPLTKQGVSPEDEVIPIVTTQGADGQAYGAAAALIRHRCKAFDGAQVLWVWGSLLSSSFPETDRVIAGALTYAVTTARPTGLPLPEKLKLALPPGDFRAAVLPPDCAGREDSIRSACEATGATPVFLSPDQFVSPGHFNVRNYPVAIQAVGGEGFVLTYGSNGDGEEAYKRYLKEGGTLIVCQPATPFWYELIWEQGKWTSRSPQRFWSMSFDLGFETQYGFEKPEETMWLELTEAGQRLWPEVPGRLELGYLTDQRWRSLIEYRSSAAREFTPLAYATKPDGTRYRGLAAAKVRFLDSEYAGATLYYIWGNAVEGATGEKLLAGCLKEARQTAAR